VPRIRALANVSANYNMTVPLQHAGFRNIHPFLERRPISLAHGYEVTRYPVSGIDNMLVIRAGGLTVVDYNDCNLPLAAVRSLARKLKQVDVLLTSYNHAGKLLAYSTHDQIKEILKKRFQLIVEAFNPTWVIPFASLHYYRSPASAYQNDSLLTGDELAATVPQVVSLAAGDRAIFASGREPRVEHLPVALPCAPGEEKQHETSLPWNRLVRAAKAYRARLQGRFWGIGRWFPQLAFRVEDLGRVLVFDLAHGISERELTFSPIHLAMHSESLSDLLENPFGASLFWIGGDFTITTEDATPIHRFMLAGLLLENRLTPRDLICMLCTPRDWSFFSHRREEIFAILLGRRFTVGDARL